MGSSSELQRKNLTRSTTAKKTVQKRQPYNHPGTWRSLRKLIPDSFSNPLLILSSSLVCVDSKIENQEIAIWGKLIVACNIKLPHSHSGVRGSGEYNHAEIRKELEKQYFSKHWGVEDIPKSNGIFKKCLCSQLSQKSKNYKNKWIMSPADIKDDHEREHRKIKVFKF